jgi:hypothetical protein
MYELKQRIKELNEQIADSANDNIKRSVLSMRSSEFEIGDTFARMPDTIEDIAQGSIISPEK